MDGWRRLREKRARICINSARIHSPLMYASSVTLFLELVVSAYYTAPPNAPSAQLSTLLVKPGLTCYQRRRRAYGCWMLLASLRRLQPSLLSHAANCPARSTVATLNIEAFVKSRRLSTPAGMRACLSMLRVSRTGAASGVHTL